MFPVSNNVAISPFDTGIFVHKVALPSSGSVEVLGPSRKRIGFVISGCGADMSFSWSSSPILNKSTFNFFGSVTYSLLCTFWLVGTAINQPLYGIGSGDGFTIEVAEINYEGPGDVYDIIQSY